MFIFFVNVSSTTGIYTYCHILSQHDALPIFGDSQAGSIGVHPKSADAPGSRRLTGSSEDEVEIGDSAIGYPGFHAIQDVVPAILNRGAGHGGHVGTRIRRSEEYTSELQSLMRISYAVFSLKKKTHDIR